MFIQFLAMLAFANMKDGVFSLQSYDTIQEQIDEVHMTTDVFLADMEKSLKNQYQSMDTLKNRVMPRVHEEISTEIKGNLEAELRFSSSMSFDQNKYF